MCEHLQNLSEFSHGLSIILDSVIASVGMELTFLYFSQMACPHNKL